MLIHDEWDVAIQRHRVAVGRQPQCIGFGQAIKMIILAGKFVRHDSGETPKYHRVMTGNS
jgi:hypothetical protein